LYFRNGYLAYKCIVADKEVNPDEVFHREIVSGLQHPANFPGFMDKVHWGEAAEPHVAAEHEGEPEHAVRTSKGVLPKVRCGIALDGLPPSVAKQKGANVLVLFQNVGPSALSDDLLLTGFPIGPVVSVRADYHETGKSTGFPSYFGFYGTKTYRIPFDKNVKVFRAAAFHLEPGECTYTWFRVPDLNSYAAVRGELHGIWGANKDGENVNIHIWDTESAKVAISKADSK
jgi:hypothetical protein